MIIGNNNSNNNFSKNQMPQLNPLIENERIKNHTNVNSKTEMANKAYDMLEQRYKSGLITLDEFTKKCNEIQKQREN